MVQIHLDPSIIKISDPILYSLGISGIHLKDIPVPGNPNIDIWESWKSLDKKEIPETFKDSLIPWHWEYPDSMVIMFFEEREDGSINRDFHPIEIRYKSHLNPNLYQQDKSELMKHYEYLLFEGIWSPASKDISQPLNYVLKNGGRALISDREENEILVNEETEPDNGVQNDFIRLSISEYSQNLTPLNEYLKLVFLNSNLDNLSFEFPKRATHYAIFPKGTNQWEHVQDDIRNPRYLATDKGLAILTYEKSLFGQPYSVICPITAIPKPPTETKPIILRNEKGDFSGTIDIIRVDDGEDWTEGIMGRIGKFYDLPQLMLEFLTKRNDIKTKDNIQKLDDFLWATMRDSLDFGYRGKINGNCLARQVWFNLKEENKEYIETYEAFKERITEANKLYKTVNITDLKIWKDDLAAAARKASDGGQISMKIEQIKNIIPHSQEPSDSFDPDKWLSLWDEMLQIFETPEFQRLVILEQWKKIKLDQGAEFDDTLINLVSRALNEQIGNIRNQNKESLIRELIFQGQENQKENIPKDVLKYFNQRIDDLQEEFFPKINLLGVDLSDFETESIKYLKSEIDDEEIFERFEKTYDIPPPVRIQVAEFESDNESEDDLSDEISGYILLMKREKEKQTDSYHEWKYLNWAKPKIITLVPEENKITKSEEYFIDDYLIPAFIPTSNGYKKPYLTLSNENLSLIAGHKTFEDINFDDDSNNDNSLHIVYDFPKQEFCGYALWYGYKYQFAAFVALNSGVLPAVLRKNGHLNLPIENPNDENIEVKTYPHLRRVPVSSPRVKAQEPEDVLVPPKDFLPLTYELNEWRENQPGGEKEQTFFLLANSTSFFEQNEITLEVKKPTTNFWNWYAWLGPDAKEYQQKALENELKNRDRSIDKGYENDKDKINILCDPAVENKILIEVQTIFPELGKLHQEVWDLPEESHGVLDDPNLNFKIKMDGLSLEVPSTVGDIKIPEGHVVKIKISSLIKASHFEKEGDDSNEGKKFPFYIGRTLENFEKEGNEYKASPSVELFIETAIKKFEIDSKILYENLELSHTNEELTAALRITNDKNDIIKEFAYLSRLDIRHQIWSWNGRLENSEILLKKIDKLNPEEGKTTCAMKWEAWAFSDRPDSAANGWKENLLAQRELTADYKPQVIFTDKRPGEEKALYYRFSLTAQSRYSPLGDSYNKSFEAKIGGIDGKNFETHWKRYLRKSNKSKPLPRPSLRFAIPLTDSIEQHKDNGIHSASILLVLNDRWFAEAGLAEQLEVGIDIVKDPGVGEGRGTEYLMAGNDPILTGKKLSQIKEKEQDNNNGIWIEENGGKKVAVFKPIGPAGLTFEPKMQTPLLRGSSFILDIPDVSTFLDKGDGNRTNQLKPWAMLQIAVRRTLRKEFCDGDIPVEALRSDWTSKEWVQFLPSANSLIPHTWKKQQQINGFVNAKLEGDKLSFPDGWEMPLFDYFMDNNGDEENEKFMERYLILTKKIFDIGGQPTEEYVATFQYSRQKESQAIFQKDDGTIPPEIKEGYIRLMLVRIRPEKNNSIDKTLSNSTGKTIWDKLFGKNTEEIQINKIQEDPEAALPLVSKRLDVKINV